MVQLKVENRGGPRPNSGRKPQKTVGQKERERLMLELRRKGRKTGISFEKLLVDECYTKEQGGVSTNQKLCYEYRKIVANIKYPKQEENKLEFSHHKEPLILLPELVDNKKTLRM